MKMPPAQSREWAEKRPLHLFRELGPNIKTWGKDVNDTYLTGAWKSKDPIKRAAGLPMAAASTFFESLDYVYAGIADDHLEAPDGGIAARTRRDIGDIVKNNIRHPIRTLFGGLRLLTDVPMDTVDLLAGYRHSGRGRMHTLFSP